MMILQILSHKSCLYDKRLLSYAIFRKFYPSKHILGGLLAKINFFRRFYLFGKFLELHFFQFQKKNYFHSTLLSHTFPISAQVSVFPQRKNVLCLNQSLTTLLTSSSLLNFVPLVNAFKGPNR